MYFDEAAFYALRHGKHLRSHSRTGLGFAQSRQKQHPQTFTPKFTSHAQVAPITSRSSLCLGFKGVVLLVQSCLSAYVVSRVRFGRMGNVAAAKLALGRVAQRMPVRFETGFAQSRSHVR